MSLPRTQTPTSKFGVRMSTRLGYTQLCVASGWNKENSRLLHSTGSGSGCGYMRLSNLRPDKPKAWILPYVNTKLFSRVLKDFAAHFGVGQNKRIVLPLDQARWHTSEQLEVPEGIHLVPLPPYSPELQPAERLWPLVDEPLANQAFETIDEAEELVIQRCRRLLKQQQLIQGLTFYHWWPDVKVAA